MRYMLLLAELVRLNVTDRSLVLSTSKFFLPYYTFVELFTRRIRGMNPKD